MPCPVGSDALPHLETMLGCGSLTCLGFERDHSGGSGGSQVGGGYRQLIALARHLGRTDEPIVRRALVDVYLFHRVALLTNRRAAGRLRAGQTPGPEASLGKLMWTANMATAQRGEIVDLQDALARSKA